MRRYSMIALPFAALLAATLACAGGGGGQDATVAALGESVSLTATAAASGSFDSGANILTAEANATAQASQGGSTAGLSEEEIAATASAEAPILAELPTYGVDPSEGRVAWIHPPETISITGFQQFDYANRFIGTIARDFVVSGDITWNTTTGLSGCGWVLRSDGNEDAFNQYLTIATRGGNGRVIFAPMLEGDIVNAQDIYAYGLDPEFEWQNDTTNRLTIVGRGEVFTVYTNGTRVGEIVAGDRPAAPFIPPPPDAPPADAPPEVAEAYQQKLDEYDGVVADIRGDFQARLNAFQGETPFFDRGFIAMVGLSESGTTTCQFNNAWLFLIES